MEGKNSHCGPHGICIDGLNTFWCICNDGYNGILCEKENGEKVIYNYYDELMHDNHAKTHTDSVNLYK